VEALSLESLVANADYVRFGLLTALLLFSRGRFVRLIVALFAGLELAYGLATGADRTTIIWMSVLLGLSLTIILIGVIAFGGARLSSDEQAMSNRLLKGIGRGRARHFMDQGYWLTGNAGEVLLREGEPVNQFCYLASGEARVLMSGRPIGFSRSGDVIGGMAFFGEDGAAATVVLATRARFWCAPSERLKPYLAAHPDMRRTLERSIGEGPPEPAEEPVYQSERPSVIRAA
jgi:CRP/FNR family transcriptional regulator, cyclic AMP receptor protein